MIRIILVVALLFPLSVLAQTSKYNGVSLVSERFVLDSTHIDPILSVNANCASVIPFCFMPRIDTGLVYYDNRQQWVGEKTKGVRTAVQLLKKDSLKVMVKPQIWVGHGVFTGLIKMNSEEDWEMFEEQYAEYILAFARLSEEEGAEVFCVGTEMAEVVANRPEFFPNLIKKVRQVYSGHLTYAENWDSFQKVQFWGALDFIGVDAYFPISDKKKPTTKDLKDGWAQWSPVLDTLSSKFDRKVLFTEYGYRSIDKCVNEPWSYERSKQDKHNEELQVKALEALFSTVWEQDYFAGGFLWKWHPNHTIAGGAKNNMFTIQNKKAEKAVREFYAAH